MLKKVTNFVLNILHKRLIPFHRTSKGGNTIRNTRLKKFKKRGKKLAIAAQLVAIWYLLILSSSYLTSDTGAYFNDEEKISGTISVAENFCKDVKNGSDFWQKYCKDNSGGGNGPDAPDTDTGGQTDPDNPGKNKESCDDHTNAPCSEVSNMKETHTSNSVTLTWENPIWSDAAFSNVKVYKNDSKDPVGNNIKDGQFVEENLQPDTKYTYKITTVDSSGKESTGVSIDVTTNKN